MKFIEDVDFLFIYAKPLFIGFQILTGKTFCVMVSILKLRN